MKTPDQYLAETRKASAEGRHEDAWRIFKLLLASHPNELMLQFDASRAALSAGHSYDATVLLKGFIAKRPDIGMAWGLLGEALIAMSQHDAAADAFAKAISLGQVPYLFHARLAGLRARSSDMGAFRESFSVAVNLLIADLTADKFDDALEKEEHLVKHAVRTIESEDHTEASFAQWRTAMTAAGERAAASAPPISPTRQECPPVVGFFIHVASTLGHVELALDYMSAMAADRANPIRPHLYVFSGFNAALLDDCHRRGIPVTFVERESGIGRAYLAYKRLLWLRERAARDGLAAMVWISVQSLVHFAAAMRLAPVNIFWALRFRGIDSPYIDGRVACASCFEREDVVHGQRWDLIPLAFNDLRGPDRSQEAAEIRRQLGDPPLLFGTFARREKMQGDAWLEAVGRSLKACPQALFVWADREEDPKVAAALKRMGVDAQSRFVGWVDTRLYSQAIDIFLDTAPVGCGMTAMEAMAWGKPLVSFKDPLTNWGQCLAPVLDGGIADPAAKADIECIFALNSGRELLAWSDSAAGYADWVRRLAEDSDLRANVGAAARAFTDKYFGDTRYAASRFAELLRGWLSRRS